MKRIVGAMHQSMVMAWYEKAVNSETARFLRITPWIESELAPADGWNKVHMMDNNATTLLSITLDRPSKTCPLALYSLPNNQGAVASAFKWLATEAPFMHDIMDFDYTFVITGTNSKWLEGVRGALARRKLYDCEWGVEPRSAFDATDGTWVPLHYFRVPVRSIARRTTNGRK